MLRAEIDGDGPFHHRIEPFSTDAGSALIHVLVTIDLTGASILEETETERGSRLPIDRMDPDTVRNKINAFFRGQLLATF